MIQWSGAHANDHDIVQTAAFMADLALISQVDHLRVHDRPEARPRRVVSAQKVSMQFQLMPICRLLEAQSTLAAGPGEEDATEAALDLLLDNRSASTLSQLRSSEAINTQAGFAIHAFRGNRQVSMVLLLHQSEA